MATKHRFESIGRQLAEKINDKVKVAADGLKGDSSQPPYTKKLSKDDQLAQYFAMDQKKWEGLIKERGLAEVVRYQTAMRKLVAERFGEPTPTTVILAPQQYAMLDEAQQTGADPNELVSDMGPPDPNTPGAQAIIQQTLQQAGVDPAAL